MRLPAVPHSWTVTPLVAAAIQRRLATRISFRPPKAAARLVAGLDAAFTANGEHCIGGVVLWDVDRRISLEQHSALCHVEFPYVPGLLSFREGPALLAALRKLRGHPDALMCDAHGLAHPRRFGLACHLGVICRLPAVGCAKSRLVGTHREPGTRRGCRTRLMDGGEVIGSVVRTRTGVKPVYVSIGHRIDLDGAMRLVLRCATGYRLPEPTRLADRLVADVKRGLLRS